MGPSAPLVENFEAQSTKVYPLACWNCLACTHSRPNFFMNLVLFLCKVCLIDIDVWISHKTSSNSFHWELKRFSRFILLVPRTWQRNRYLSALIFLFDVFWWAVQYLVLLAEVVSIIETVKNLIISNYLYFPTLKIREIVHLVESEYNWSKTYALQKLCCTGQLNRFIFYAKIEYRQHTSLVSMKGSRTQTENLYGRIFTEVNFLYRTVMTQLATLELTPFSLPIK